MRFRLILAAAVAATLAAASPVSAQVTLNVVSAGDQNMVDYVNNYLGPKFEADEPRRQGARRRHGSRRRGLAEDLREALGAAEGRGRLVGRRRRGRSPARRGDDGQRETADALSQRRCRGQARLARHREERAGGERRRLRAADVPQPDRVRVQPRPRQGAAEVLRGARRVGEEEPEAVRLQRRQGRHVGRGLRDGLGLGELGARRQAREGPLRGERQGGDREVARRPQGVQPERRDDAGERRDARHAESRRDRDGAGVGRHVLHVASRRQDEPEDQARAAATGASRPADVLRDSGKGRERRAREEIHRHGREPRSAGRRHRQAVQLVSGHRSAVRAGEAAAGGHGTSSSPTSRRRTSRSTAGRSRCPSTSPTSSKDTSGSC